MLSPSSLVWWGVDFYTSLHFHLCCTPVTCLWCSVLKVYLMTKIFNLQSHEEDRKQSQPLQFVLTAHYAVQHHKIDYLLLPPAISWLYPTVNTSVHHSQQLCSTLSVGLLQKQLNISQWVTTVTYTQQMDSQCLYPVFLEAQLQAIVQLSRHHFTFQCSMFNAFQDLKIVVSFHKLHKGKAVVNMNTNQFQSKAKDGLYPETALLWTCSCFSPGSWLLIHSNEVHDLASLTLGLVLVLLKSVTRRTSEASI